MLTACDGDVVDVSAEAGATGRTIVHFAAEYFPYARTGGLAEAVAGLAQTQARAGERVVVFLPLYPSVREHAPDLEPLAPPQQIVIGGRGEEFRFFSETKARGNPTVVFVDAPGYFARSGLYGQDGGDYQDNHRRFALYCRAALEGVRQLLQGPVLLHAHDWHAALVPAYLRTNAELDAALGHPPVMMSVHNAGYQGHFPPSLLPEVGLPSHLWSVDHFEWYGHANVLKGGLSFSDAVFTVSPSHARELCTVEGGFGLHDTFRLLGSRLHGICNGIDHGVWDPAGHPWVVSHYARAHLDGKTSCKDALQRTMGLARRPDVPLFAMVARLAHQKGFDIVLQSERIRTLDAQFVFLGEGEPGYQARLSALARERPDSIAVEFGFTDLLEHRVISGADAVLMPSLYEPCGLTQMHALRYGAPVIGRATGGIQDTIEDGVTGFLFDEFSATALDAAIDRAMTLYASRRSWRAMVRRGMDCDFAWERAERSYRAAYDTAEEMARAGV
ncbi:MAG: glycogen synthase [Gemmatimonadetes bacterium]|nr:glycogen synthase [Gemmatimonadota bacterium]